MIDMQLTYIPYTFVPEVRSVTFNYLYLPVRKWFTHIKTTLYTASKLIIIWSLAVSKSKDVGEICICFSSHIQSEFVLSSVPQLVVDKWPRIIYWMHPTSLVTNENTVRNIIGKEFFSLRDFFICKNNWGLNGSVDSNCNL